MSLGGAWDGIIQESFSYATNQRQSAHYYALDFSLLERIDTIMTAMELRRFGERENALGIVIRP